MFEPANRHNLLDLLRPPSGYRLDSAIGTTYSMDFVALTAVMLAFVDAEPEGDAGNSNPAEVLRAITRLSHRVRIFANRGRIGIDRTRGANKLFCLFDRIVREVKPELGCFHPKVWAARYTPKDTPGNLQARPITRFLCGSRNLSTSQCWEAFFFLEGQELGMRPKSRLGAQVADFIKWLDDSEASFSALVNGLRNSEFILTKESRDRCDFLWQKPGANGLFDRVPAKGQRAVVVSPFVRKSFLERILNRFVHVTIISTQRELDAIDDDRFHDRLSAHDIYVVRSNEVEAGSVSMDLHAKLLLCEGDAGNATMIGSANASDSAWRGRNCEALISFSPGLPADRFTQQFLFDEKGSLWGWAERYERRPFVKTEEDVAEDELEQIRDAVGRATLLASYDAAIKVLTFTARNEELPRLLADLAGRVEVKACPLALFDVPGSLKHVHDLVGLGLSFSAISVADLSEFVAIEITHGDLDSPCVMILKAESDFGHLMGDRDAAVLKQLLTKENFQDFLQSILFDQVRTTPKTSLSEARGQGGGFTGELFHGATMEDILQSCTEDPTRIAEIDGLLKTFEGTDLVDPTFRQFWDTFHVAFTRAQEGLSRG